MSRLRDVYDDWRRDPADFELRAFRSKAFFWFYMMAMASPLGAMAYREFFKPLPPNCRVVVVSLGRFMSTGYRCDAPTPAAKEE